MGKTTVFAGGLGEDLHWREISVRELLVKWVRPSGND